MIADSFGNLDTHGEGLFTVTGMKSNTTKS